MTIIKINTTLKRVVVETENTTVFIETAKDGELFDIHYSSQTGERIQEDEKEWEQSQLFEFYNIIQIALMYATKNDLSSTNSAMDKARAVIPFEEYIVE